MTFTDVMGLLGGLALFLYGMQMMSSGLENVAGNKMKQILEKLTANRFVGVLVGAGITAVIQSSSATTVMVVGFVNSGMMTLRQAVWIIMGANIGTTITGQLIALDVGAFAPIIAFIGVAMIVFLKNEKLHHIGSILAGLGVLFIGMDMMSGAMKPLANSEEFVGLLTKFENPVLGILAGTVFTALIQSSSASVGILQALANSGVIGLSSAAFVLFGQNIGTCVTALLASIGTNRNARRTTVIHISFNVIGTVIFTTLCLVTPLIAFMESLTPTNPSAQIANLHTTFNVVTSLLLIPFGGLLTLLAEKLLPDKGDKKEEGPTLHYLLDLSHINADKLGVTAISMEGIRKELQRMLDMARENVIGAFWVFAKKDIEQFKEIEQREAYVDFLNKEISKYITKAAAYDNTQSGSQQFNSYFTITSNIERLSDHAINIAGYSRILEEKQIQFSEAAEKEIWQMQNVCKSLFEMLQEDYKDVVDWHSRVAGMEQRIDDMTKDFRSNMYERIHKGICSDEGSILFSEMLTDFERIGDHALNISDEMVKIAMAEGY
ncbi:MAG: Na/Pi cotransporter family protein [Lachnospiraceae bacterium]|nr:Na/Pi cotransporter family protein [Lachnospiraceae bacterium]MBP3352905.1 Na/Pi cotransporter family protein [Lachnospiraceae bacterium]